MRLLRWIASLRVTVIGLMFLLVLTVWGTLYQADHGLYLAQERFYQSWFILIGGVVPFPGAQTIMAILFANLVTSMIVLAVRGRLRWGLVITHGGLLLMLAAGAVTFYLGRNAQLSLMEGASSNVALAFGEWELSVIEPSDPEGRKVTALPLTAMREGRTVALPGSSLAFAFEQVERNCEATTDALSDAPRNGSGFTALSRRARGKELSDDRPGVVFTLLRDGKPEDRYLLWAGDPNPLLLSDGERRLMIGLRTRRLPLPATIELVDFRRELHPGSGIAKSYSSQVIVRTGEEADRKVLISMNKPLRIDGFTFYQSSFANMPSGVEMSTLAVVHNYGRTMPYVATGLTFVGMLMHFTGMLVTRLRKKDAIASAGGEP